MAVKKRILISIDVENNKTEVGGTGNAWDDMACILEGLAVICQACVNEGISKDSVYGEVQKYFNKISAAGGYKVMKIKHYDK